MRENTITGLETSISKMVFGILAHRGLEIVRDLQTLYTQEEIAHLEQENMYRAVAYLMLRMLVLRA